MKMMRIAVAVFDETLHSAALPAPLALAVVEDSSYSTAAKENVDPLSGCATRASSVSSKRGGGCSRPPLADITPLRALPPLPSRKPTVASVSCALMAMAAPAPARLRANSITAASASPTRHNDGGYLARQRRAASLPRAAPSMLLLVR